MSSTIQRPRVYISYSWRHHKTKKKALWLADKLRENGIDSRIDLYYGKSLHGFTPPEPAPEPERDDWDYWQEEQIKAADRVIILCTREYASSGPESGVIRDLRYMKAEIDRTKGGRRKVIPVGVGSYEANQAFIPPLVQGATYYDIGSRQKGVFGLDDLVRRLKTEFPSATHPPLAHKSSRTEIKGAKPMTESSLKASDLRGRIHAAIMTIRQDEYEAVEAKLGNVQPVDGNNTYKYAEIETIDGRQLSVVVTRTVGQGNTKAQAVASNIIHELDPSWLLLVGIAGGVPDIEYSLGDVVLATYLHDFSLTAASDNGVTRQTVGGEMHRDVIRFLSTRAVGADAKRLSELAGFQTDNDLVNHPPVYSPGATNKRYYGPTKFRQQVQRSIESRFPNGKRNGGPWIRQGPCANGNVLLKSPSLLEEWQQSARHIVQVEMELAGVYEAAKSSGRENYPVLAIRGLSDIVGFARDPRWTAYACKTAAAFASAVLRSGFIDFDKNLPHNPDIRTESASHAEIVPPPESRRSRSAPALAMWQKKLAFLQIEEAKASDAAQKFSLQQQIEEALSKIAELGG